MSFASQLPPYCRLAIVSYNFVQTQLICTISFVYRMVYTSSVHQLTVMQLSVVYGCKITEWIYEQGPGVYI